MTEDKKKLSKQGSRWHHLSFFFILMFLEWPADGDDVFEADSFLFHEMLAAPEKQEKVYKTKKNNVIFGSC